MATKELYEEIATVLQAWLDRRPDKRFFGMSVTNFADIVSPTFKTRGELVKLEQRMHEVRTHRDKADRISRHALQGVVNAVKGDPTEGEDGDLYAAMGYKPRRLRLIICAPGKDESKPEWAEKEVVEDEG